MSRTLYGFLADSLLFREELLVDKYASLDRSELERELYRYREYVLQNIKEIQAEVYSNGSALSIYFDTTTNTRPTVDMLKQCALYYDRAVVDDPLFGRAKLSHPMSVAAKSFLGYDHQTVDPNQIASAALFMKNLTSMVAAGFLKFYPVSLHHELPEDIPLRYSQTLFSEGIPPQVAPLFNHHARISPLRWNEGGWQYSGNDLSPSRGICIRFEGYDQSFIYHLLRSEVQSFDEQEGTVTIAQSLPEEPPGTDEFRLWCIQSVNQSAHEILRHTAADLHNATLSSSLLATGSPFIAELLAAHPHTHTNLQTDLARMAMQINVPVLASVSVDNLMKIRTEDGEAFLNFRMALQRHVRELRQILSADELTKRLEEVSHELMEVQLHDINNKIKRIKQELLIDGIIGTASLATVIPTGGTSLIGLILAGLKAASTAKHYLNEVKLHPAFFLWRMTQSGSGQSSERGQTSSDR